MRWKTINGVCVYLTGVIQCAAYSMALSFHLLEMNDGEKKNLSKVSEPRFRCKSLAWSLDNGFCPCSYNCSLILSYFYNFVICSERNCILFLGNTNTVNDDDAFGVISLVMVSQAGKFFLSAVFPTIVCCWLSKEPRNTAWHISL
jgi:hypothetical protein